MPVDSAPLAGGATAAPRRDFHLPEADEEFLDAAYPGWQTVRDGATPWLVLTGFPVPDGYSLRQVQAAIQIPSGYPNSPLDMVYFLPGLSRTSGRPIACLASQPIAGQTWQRWSRHYQWRAGIDDLITHMERIKAWLDEQLAR